MSTYMFAGQYRQRPAPPSGGVIKADLISVIDAVPHNVVEWCRGWDLGATLDGDFTAGAKLGRMSDGRYVVADMKRERLESHKRDQLMRNTEPSQRRECRHGARALESGVRR